MTILRSELRCAPGTVWRTSSHAVLFRAMFLTLREYNGTGLLCLLEDPETEPLMAKGVLEPDDSPWWNSVEYQTVYGWLTTLMQACAPPDHYFGARWWGPDGFEGDNYGYWPLSEVQHHEP